MSNPGQGSAAQNGKANEPKVFSKGDIVWAKVRGYSWWPAKISKVQIHNERDRKYLVSFFGDGTTADLSSEKVCDFVDNFVKNSITKKKDLIDAIDSAKKCLRKDELVALDKKNSGGDSARKQMQKSGNVNKDEFSKAEKFAEKQSKAEYPGKQSLSAAQDTNRYESIITPTKCSSGDQSSIQNKGSTKRMLDSEKQQIKDKSSMNLNKRQLKTTTKKAERQRKVSEDQEATLSEEDEEEEQIICTKSKASSRHKKPKKVLKLGKRVVQESKEIEILPDLLKRSNSANFAEEMKVEVILSSVQDKDLVAQYTKKQQEETMKEHLIDPRDEETTVKDQSEPLPSLILNDGKKETRKAASRANELFKDFATKGHKHMNLMNSHDKSDLHEIGEKIHRPQKSVGKTTPNMRDDLLELGLDTKKTLQKTQGAQRSSQVMLYQSVSLESESMRHSPQGNATYNNNNNHQNGKASLFSNQQAHQRPVQSKLHLQCKQIQKFIKAFTRDQQHEEENLRNRFELNEHNVNVYEANGIRSLTIKEALPRLNSQMMDLFRIDNMTIEVLIETGIGKTLKYLLDYCDLYKQEFQDLYQISIRCQQIIVKWKNLVNNIIFDDKKNYSDGFSKSKYKLKCEKLKKAKTPHQARQLMRNVADFSPNDYKDKLLQRQGSANKSILSMAYNKFEEDEMIKRSRQNSVSYNRTMSGIDEKHYSNPGTHDSGAELIEPMQQMTASKSESPSKSDFLKPLEHQIKPFSPDKLPHQ